jgi:hypothetical protein
MVPPEKQPDALDADSALDTWPHADTPLELDFMPAPKKIRKPDAEEIGHIPADDVLRRRIPGASSPCSVGAVSESVHCRYTSRPAIEFHAL